MDVPKNIKQRIAISFGIFWIFVVGLSIFAFREWWTAKHPPHISHHFDFPTGWKSHSSDVVPSPRYWSLEDTLPNFTIAEFIYRIPRDRVASFAGFEKSMQAHGEFKGNAESGGGLNWFDLQDEGKLYFKIHEGKYARWVAILLVPKLENPHSKLISETVNPVIDSFRQGYFLETKHPEPYSQIPGPYDSTIYD